MYSVADYGRMAADSVRMDAYQRAIARTVRPGAVVLDLGAGTGIMSLLALRAGASRVHAVEPNPAVWLLPELAHENGVQDRIVVHGSGSLEMEPPEPIDVVVSDMRGALPLCGENLAALHDVKERWLSPTGVILPERDLLRVVVVEATAMDAYLEAGVSSFERLGFKADAARRSIRNQIYSDSQFPVAASDMLTTAETWATLEYGAPPPKTFQGTVSLVARRGGRARGLCCFFETRLCDGVEYETTPGQSIVYNRLYMPLLESIALEVGDEVHATVRVDAQGERYAWDTAIERSGKVIAHYRQATFLGTPSSMESLLRASEISTPKLGKKGLRLQKIFSAMDGTRTVRDIANAVSSDDRTDALELVRNLAILYGS